LIQPWQDRFRDPALTVLLALEICTIFLAAPLTAKGLPTAQVVADTLVLAVIAIVVMVPLRWSAIILILLGLAAIVASFLISAEGVVGLRNRAPPRRRHPDLLCPVLGRGARGLCAWTYCASSASRRHRNVSELREHLRRGLWADLGIESGAFANLVVQGGGPEEIESMLYFSFTTLTTTDYGDIVAVDPFERSLANFESVLGQFFIAITVARLVAMELADRHQ
jgi:hypothetical protein